MSDRISQLTIEDTDFLVESLIERCPRTMMARELVQNAIEAARNAPEGERWIECGATMINGAPKLTFRNSGPGLGRRELIQLTNIADSIGKTLSVEENFGMGAKVATLASNKLGVRYRSCREGFVHEVMMGYHNGVYGRIWRRQGDSPRLVEVADVTDELLEAGADLNSDWTEVVLMGNSEDQNTVTDPYGGQPVVGQHWLPDTLYKRYFRLDPDIRLTLSPELHGLGGSQPFFAVSSRLETAFQQHECVTTSNGLKIHYVADQADPEKPWLCQSERDALQPAAGRIAVVYRDEIFAAIDGQAWASNGPVFGISSQARYLSIFIELPDDFPVLPDSYRTHLRYREGGQQQVMATDFAALVRSHIPAWLRERLASTSKPTDAFNHVLGELQQLWAEQAPNKGRLPLELLILNDPDEIRYRWLLGRGGQYYRDTGQLAINLTYHSITQLQERLLAQTALGKKPDPADAARKLAELAFTRRIARGVVYALAKAENPELWQDQHITNALAPEGLTILGDDVTDMFSWAAGQVDLEA